MSYDCNGNLTFDGVLTYTYNPQNRLMLVQNGTTQVATYVYDGVDRRVTKTVGSTVTNFLNDGEDEIAEYGPTGTVLRRFVPGRAINDPIAYDNCVGATAPNCTGTVAVSFFATDHHGSVVAMSESSGNPATGGADGPFTYDVYGVSPSNMGGVPFRYVGMYYDAETGLYYDRARYYSSALGRFLQDDPVGYKVDLDLYTYVGDDPEDKLDPSGKCPICAAIVAAAAVGAVIGGATGAIVEGASEYHSGHFSLAKMAISTGAGVVTGGVSGAVGAVGLGFAATAAIGAGAGALIGAVAGGAKASVDNKSVAQGAINGAVGGAVGGLAGSAVGAGLKLAHVALAGPLGTITKAAVTTVATTVGKGVNTFLIQPLMPQPKPNPQSSPVH